MATRVAIMGAPGAGKGTQARMLAARFGLRHISTGDILRDAAAAGTKLGNEARTYMDAGRLVPDDVVVGIVEARLRDADCANGYILDGFPRTVPQAKALEKLGQRMSAVIQLDVPREELVRRLSGRRVCRGCGRMYHVALDPPRTADRCDACSGELFQRDDDREEPIGRRMDVYAAETAPVLDHYRAGRLLHRVSGTGSRDDVFARVAASIR